MFIKYARCWRTPALDCVLPIHRIPSLDFSLELIPQKKNFCRLKGGAIAEWPPPLNTPLLDCLGEMSQPAAGSNVTARASGLRSQLCKGSTLLALKMALKVFGLPEMLNRSLQARYQTVSGMLKAVDETLSGLRDLRLDAAFDKLLADIEEIVVELDLEALTVPRQRKPPKRYTGDAVPRVAITICDYYHPWYFELVDNAVQQLEDRFHGDASLLKY